MALLPPPELGLPAPPDESLAVLDGFDAALDELPKKKPGNLLIGTWNIRHFGRVRSSGLVGELVIPDEELEGAGAIMQRQFVRTPYTVSFQAREKGFTLVTLHVVYGTKSTPEVRTPEIARFAEWLRENAEEPDEFNRKPGRAGGLQHRQARPRQLAGARGGRQPVTPLWEEFLLDA